MIIDDVAKEVADALGISVDQLELSANLISLGLDSIKIMKLSGGWRRRGYRINFAQFAAQPTVTAWGKLLAECSRSLSKDQELLENAAGTISTSSYKSGDAFDAHSAFALAPMQHAYWVGRSAATDLGGVAAHLYVEFDGVGIDQHRLESAVTQLVLRHEMLRAKFLANGTQEILAEAPGKILTVIDLQNSLAQNAIEELAVLRDQKTHQQLAIAEGQVFDFTLTLLPQGRHRFHFDIDMLVADAQSYRVLLADLVALYAGTPLPSLDYRYQDYLVAKAMQPELDRSDDRQWWQNKLAQLPEAPALPMRKDSQNSGSCRVVRYHHQLSGVEKRCIENLAQHYGLTTVSTMLAAFVTALGCWSATSRFLLNVPLFQRESLHADVDKVSGDFSSSVLVDADCFAGESIVELARTLQNTVFENSAHGSYGALDVLRDVSKSRGETVLAPIVFTSALGLGELFSEDITEVFGEPVHIVSQGPQVLLDAQITEFAGGVLINWDVREEAFAPGVIEEMFERYIAEIVQLVSADPVTWQGARLPDIPVAQEKIREAVNSTFREGTDRVLHSEFFRLAKKNPDTPALFDTDQSWTYGELAAEALRVAGALAAMGVHSGEAVAVQLPKGAPQVIATLGVFALGATWVPIGFDQPELRCAAIIEAGNVKALLTTRELGESFSGAVDFETARKFPKPIVEEVIPTSSASAYLLFTSGSTGVPKGVEVSHAAAMNTIDDINLRFEVNADSRSLMIAALEFDISVYDIFGIYSAGGAVVAVSVGEAKDPQAWLRLVKTHKVSVLTCVPSAFDMLLTEAENSEEGLGTSIQTVLLGGDWVGADLPRRLHALVPTARFAGLGGATEVAIHCTVCEIYDPPKEWATIPFGTPLNNMQCRIVDAAGRDRPDWVVGEFWVSGPGLAKGYKNLPEQTAKHFVQHKGKRWYRTGDTARYWPDGTIEFLGRADQQVKVRGFRIELGEVENALREIAGVKQVLSAVHRGQLIAAVTVLDHELAPTRLVTELSKVLPAYMIPTQLMVADTLPLTKNGKLDRGAVEKLFTAFSINELVPLSTDLERAVAIIISEVLGIDAAEIGRATDFFAVGGDSVLATTVIARIRVWLDALEATVADIFSGRTIAGIADRLMAGDISTGRLELIASTFLEVSAELTEVTSEF